MISPIDRRSVATPADPPWMTGAAMRRAAMIPRSEQATESETRLGQEPVPSDGGRNTMDAAGSPVKADGDRFYHD
ncbi:hypothetical protein AB0L34_24730 [Micromonospora sp. NPDC052213]|uniref:hypothetical protein n=1 Tax=Micromonospora sp. NPDC052213 TaxID=3155812 RepID=UPI003420359F